MRRAYKYRLYRATRSPEIVAVQGMGDNGNNANDNS